MADTLRPAATKLKDRENWIWVPAIADITAPTVAELTAASALDVSRIWFADGTDRPTVDTSTSTEPRRFGDGDQFEQLDTTTYTGGVAIFVRGPQAADGSDQVKLWETWEDGASGFLVNRQGLPRDQAPAANDKVDVWPVDVSAASPTTVGDGASAQAAGRSRFVISERPKYGVVVTA